MLLFEFIAIESLMGLGIIFLVLFDVFQSVIVPRFTPRHFQMTSFIIGQCAWPIYRALCLRIRPGNLREVMLGSFGPMSFLVMQLIWVAMLIVGYALLLFGLGNDIVPRLANFHSACYFAGTSLLTLGFGDVVAVGGFARFCVLSAAVTGVSVMAVAISFLFSLQSCVQRREATINSIEIRAGSPASGLQLLLTYRRLGIVTHLGSSFQNWEAWAADILETHRSFPILSYFRSSQPDVSWIAALGSTLDASALLCTCVENVPTGEARLFHEMGRKTLVTLCEYLGLTHVDKVGISRAEFERALELLNSAGYKTVDRNEAWRSFSEKHASYAGHVAALARNFACAAPGWLEPCTAHGVVETDASKIGFAP